MNKTYYLGANSWELAEVPAGDFDNTVVETRLEAGSGCGGDRVLDVGQWKAEGQLGSNVRKRKTSGLTSQSRTAWQPGVHLHM